MGFLDRIVSDLIARETGFKSKSVRKMIRKAGGSNLIMAGGAAIAGALLVDNLQKKKTTPGLPPVPAYSPPSSSPSLPPKPNLPPVPNLPPLPTSDPIETTAESEETLEPDLLFAVLRTMVAAAYADGELAPQERKILDKNFGDAPFDADRMMILKGDLQSPPGVSTLASLLTTIEERKTAYSFAWMVIQSDGSATEVELRWLQALADVLELSEEDTRQLRQKISAAE